MERPSNVASPRLIVVLLRGAVDGLSMVAPHGDPAYRPGRPGIAIAAPGQPDGLAPLTSLFGLHPALAPTLLPLWEQGQLSFVHASGSPDPTRSHFDAQDYLETATPGRKATPDGWLNRLASVLTDAGSNNPQARLEAVNLGPTMPRIFTGLAPVASLATGTSATQRGALDRPPYAAAFTQLYAGSDRLSQTVREAVATRREIIETLGSDDPTADRGALALQGLPADVARLGQLMARDPRVRLAVVPVGGWDTHINQGAGTGQLANRFNVLGQSLEALVRNLGDRFADTTILVMSEFGRTLRQNGSGGTDHGRGNVACVIAGLGLARSQVLGEWPGLEQSALNEGRDLAITTDFREVIATVLEQRWRLNDAQLARVLPSMPARRRLALFA